MIEKINDLEMKLEISENSLIEAKSQVEYLRVIRKSI